MSWPQINPYVRLAFDNWTEPGWQIPMRVIYDYEVMLLKHGELEVIADGKKHHGIPGDIFLFRPRSPHSIRSIGAECVRQPHIHFDLVEDELSPYVYINFDNLDNVPQENHKLFRPDILDEFDPGLPCHIRLKNSKNIESLLFSIINEYELRMVYSDLIIRGLFVQLFSTLLRDYRWGNADASEQTLNIAYQVKEYLDENLHREVCLDELADHIHVSKYHLSRQFKQTFNSSPIQYHLHSRLNRAKELLVTTHHSIGYIAYCVGFQSISSFSRAFKTKEHVPPSIYRK
jgi:AraC-like DNA-binding protein